MKKNKIILLGIAAFLLMSLYACKGDGGSPEPPSFESGRLTITFDYEKQSGMASNQFAVWIEDMEGNYIKTLYATKYTANGGYKDRPDSIALWVEKSDLASMQKSEVDAIAGPTPKAGNLSYSWDLTDVSGNAVLPGEYKFCVEGTLRWKNCVIYSGAIKIGGEAAEVTADVTFTYKASEGYNALTDDSTENSMIGAVTAKFEPSGGE